MTTDAKFSDLLGKTITDIKNSDNESLTFTLSNGEKYRQFHDQDCCERVTIEDIAGDLNDLLDSPLVMADEVNNHDEVGVPEGGYSGTWTFYKMATAKGSVTIRWYGESNGYYSESVDFEKV